MIEQARLWVPGRFRRQTVPSLALLLITFGSLVYGVASAVRGIEPSLLWPIVGTALLLGWGLASSRVAGWRVAIVSFLLGCVLILLLIGQLGDPLVTLCGELGRFVWQAVQGVFWPDVGPIQTAWGDLADTASALGDRVYTWLLGLARGRERFDPMPVALLWGLALWGTAMWATWAVRRRAQPMWGVIPAGALLASTLAYVGGRALYLLPVLAATLVLRALVGYDTRRRRWDRIGVRYPQRTQSDTVWLAVGLTVAMMIFAAIIPSISVYSIVEFARDLTQERAGEEEVADSLGLEQQSEPVPMNLSILDARRSGNLPTRHLIGSGPELAERVVMFVSIEPVHPGMARVRATDSATNTAVLDQPAPNYYWRSLTYDRYTDRGWSAEYAGKVTYKAGELANPVSMPNQRLLRQKVHMLGERGELLFVAGALVTADREYQVAWRLGPSEEEPGDAFGALIEAGDYWADSLLPVASETGLRASGQDYPAWIVDRYLQLPDGVPDRVRALARDLTASERTPYDRAVAIERYLRRFPYTLELPSPPTDQDITDYFLFDLQKGYCDYYATAMVVLARAAGLPARLVTGYASGTYDETEARYIITEAEAHAWAEIYFPGYGWIEFEPTAARTAIERPVEAAAEMVPASDVPPEPITTYRSRAKWAWWLGAGGGLILLPLGSVIAWMAADRWRLRRLPPTAAVTAVYRRLYRYEQWLGMPSRHGDTPHEFTAAVTLRLRELAGSRRWSKLLISAADDVRLVAELCTLALYSLHKPRVAEKAQALRAWGRLRWRLWFARLLARAPGSRRLLS